MFIGKRGANRHCHFLLFLFLASFSFSFALYFAFFKLHFGAPYPRVFLSSANPLPLSGR